eukprot:g16442.t1
MAGASEGEIPEEECSPEGLEQTMRRVLKSELEAQTDLLRQQINEDVSLHFAERSVEAISRKAQEIVEASITLENSLRDHKETCRSPSSVWEKPRKPRVDDARGTSHFGRCCAKKTRWSACLWFSFCRGFAD